MKRQYGKIAFGGIWIMKITYHHKDNTMVTAKTIHKHNYGKTSIHDIPMNTLVAQTYHFLCQQFSPLNVKYQLPPAVMDVRSNSFGDLLYAMSQGERRMSQWTPGVMREGPWLLCARRCDWRPAYWLSKCEHTSSTGNSQASKSHTAAISQAKKNKTEAEIDTCLS